MVSTQWDKLFSSDERHWIGSSLVQVMACRPCHWSNQLYLIVNWTLRNKPQWRINTRRCIFRCRLQNVENIVTLSNENMFRVTGPLCGEFIGHQRIPEYSCFSIRQSDTWFCVDAFICLCCCSFHYISEVFMPLFFSTPLEFAVN